MFGIRLRFVGLKFKKEVGVRERFGSYWSIRGDRGLGFVWFDIGECYVITFCLLFMIFLGVGFFSKNR